MLPQVRDPLGEPRAIGGAGELSEVGVRGFPTPLVERGRAEALQPQPEDVVELGALGEALDVDVELADGSLLSYAPAVEARGAGRALFLGHLLVGLDGLG